MSLAAVFNRSDRTPSPDVEDSDRSRRWRRGWPPTNKPAQRDTPGWHRAPQDSPEESGESDQEAAHRDLPRVRFRTRGRLVQERERATTAHACSLYAFGIHESLGQRGVFLGTDQLGGGNAFIFDPFYAMQELVSEGVTNTNMMVLGQPGFGKSALIKTLLYRSACVFETSRFTTICDVKGEYHDLAELCGFELIQLVPGGDTRVNPLEVIGDVDDPEAIFRARYAALKALVEMTMPEHRALSVLEDAILIEAIQALAAIDVSGVQPILSDVLDQLSNPDEAAFERLHCTKQELKDQSRDLKLIVSRLIDGPLGGMFNGQSTVKLDPAGPGVVIDISAVATDLEALPLVWVAASTWLRMLMLRKNGRQKIQVLDESWKMLTHGPLASFLQDCWKLMRSYGGANIAILHKPGDLSAQSDDGTAASKISQGLLADTAIRVTYRQSRNDLDTYATLLGYGPAEIDLIAGLQQGQSFWKLGDKAAQLDHHIWGEIEEALCDTNQAIQAATES